MTPRSPLRLQLADDIAVRIEQADIRHRLDGSCLQPPCLA